MARTTVAPKDAILSKLADHAGSTTAELSEMSGIGFSTAGKALAALEKDGLVVRTAGERVNGKQQAATWALPAPEPQAEPEPVQSEAKPATQHLRKGELRALVLRHMLGRLGQELTPTAIANELGHSAGAITNALKKMAKEGTITQTSDKPRRYVAASSHAEVGTGSLHVTRTGREALERMVGPERAAEVEASLTGQPVARHSVTLDLGDGPDDGGAVVYPFFRS